MYSIRIINMTDFFTFLNHTGLCFIDDDSCVYVNAPMVWGKKGWRQNTRYAHLHLSPGFRVVDTAGSVSMAASSVFRPGLFKHKVAIVTGGGTGIGKAIAVELLELGGWNRGFNSLSMLSDQLLSEHSGSQVNFDTHTGEDRLRGPRSSASTQNRFAISKQFAVLMLTSSRCS